MTESNSVETDVLIAGAGPTGLTMASELVRRGITPRIIDKAPVPTDKSRAFAIHPRTLELFDNMGIVDEVLSQGNACNAFDMFNRGEPLAHVSFENLESKYPFVVMLAQSDTERILTRHLNSFGIEIERENEITGINQSEDSVTAGIKLKNGIVEQLRCRYIAGCDGAHSSVRHLLNLPFKGAPYPNYWLLADCSIDWKYPVFHLSIFIHPAGVTAYFPLRPDRGRLMFELEGAPIDEELPPPTIDDVYRLLKQREIDFHSVTDPNWLTYFKLHHRMVDRYGYGRVFLSGDSAHIHSPIGGQGMNTGIQDAYNLAWKLALVLQGKSPASILDSYNIERGKVGKKVVGLTDAATNIATIHNPVLAAIRNKMVGMLSKLEPVQEKILNTLTQIEYHYKESPIVEERWFESREAPGYLGLDHDLKAGERIKDYELDGTGAKESTGLYDLLKGGEHELLIFPGKVPEDMELKEIARVYELVIKECGGLVVTHLILASTDQEGSLPNVPSTWVDKGLQMHRDFGAAKSSLYLIRPDGYIAFRNQPASATDLREYLSTIFNL